MEWASSYTIHIDEAWTLDDLHVFSYMYEQVYFAIYSLDPHHDDKDADRIAEAYSAFPWQGGYSAVNFYNQLRRLTPESERPSIRSISYGSPGWIELASITLNVAFILERLVKSICSSLTTFDATYTQLVKGMQDRKLLRLRTKEEVETLQGYDLDYVEYAASMMAKTMGVSDIRSMNDRTGHPYRSLKILFSLFRRARVLAEYQRSGKADFNNSRE